MSVTVSFLHVKDIPVFKRNQGAYSPIQLMINWTLLRIRIEYFGPADSAPKFCHLGSGSCLDLKTCKQIFVYFLIYRYLLKQQTFTVKKIPASHGLLLYFFFIMTISAKTKARSKFRIRNTGSSNLCPPLCETAGLLHCLSLLKFKEHLASNTFFCADEKGV